MSDHTIMVIQVIKTFFCVILLCILVGVYRTMLTMGAASFCVCVSDLPFPLIQISVRRVLRKCEEVGRVHSQHPVPPASGWPHAQVCSDTGSE